MISEATIAIAIQNIFSINVLQELFFSPYSGMKDSSSTSVCCLISAHSISIVMLKKHKQHRVQCTEQYYMLLKAKT